MQNVGTSALDVPQQELSIAQRFDLVENLAHGQDHDARIQVVAEHRVGFACDKDAYE